MDISAAAIMVHNINQRVQYWVEQAQEKGAGMSEENNYNLWKNLYDVVFSDDISAAAFEWCRAAGHPLDYYDPDTSYQEDVEAFAQGLKWWCDEHPLFDTIPQNSRSFSL